MAKCSYCNQRKGKRPCPVLTAICPRCCGEHRAKDIACPPECVWLRPSGHGQGDVLRRAVDLLMDFVTTDDRAWFEAASREFLRNADGPEDWEVMSHSAYVCFAYEEKPGERAVDRLLAHAGDRIASDEAEALRSLRASRVAMLCVDDVKPGVGVRVRDVLSQEAWFLHERLMSRNAHKGTHVLAWIVEHERRFEFTGAATSVPPAHIQVVRDALAREVDRLGASQPGTTRDDLVARAMPVAHEVLREAIRNWKPPRITTEDGEEVAACRAVYEIKDAELVCSRLEAETALEAVEPGVSFVWREPGVPFDIEVSRVRLTISTITRGWLERGKQLVARVCGGAVSHRFDEIKDPADLTASADDVPAETELLPSFSELGLEDPPEDATRDDIAAFHEAFEEKLQQWVEANPGAMRELAKRRKPKKPRHGTEVLVDEGRKEHGLPPLAHEVMYAHVAGLRETVTRIAGRLRGPDPTPKDPAAARLSGLSAAPEIDKLMRGFSAELSDRGWPRDEATAEAMFVAQHLPYLVRYELWRRKTLWVDGALAWMLARTDLDLPGALLRLPFASCAIVFTDPPTLELAAELIDHDRDAGPFRGRGLRILTVYVTELPEDEDTESRDVEVCLLCDTDGKQWPYLVARTLHVRPEDHLDSILDSHAPDVDPSTLPPVLLAPELKELLRLTLNAVLYATSAHLDPIVLEPRRKRRPPDEEGAQKRSREQPPQEAPADGRSSESVFFLPGKIDISRVRVLQDLERAVGGQAIHKRFMVRGHWRRAPASWKDQKLRWIEPYWKGPDMAAVIEKEYRLRAGDA